MKIQVWVLRVNGTMLAQKSSFVDTLCNAGECTDHLNFIFEHVAPDELAGVVMRVDGKLIVRDIDTK